MKILSSKIDPDYLQEDEGTYSCLAENVAGRVEERLQVIVTESEEEQQTSHRYRPAQSPYQQRYPEEEAEEEEEPDWYSQVQPPYQQMYPGPSEEQQDYERTSEEEQAPRYPPHLGYQFQFEEEEELEDYAEDIPENMPGLGVGGFEHEVNTKEGRNVDLDCLAIGSLPEDAQVDWRMEDGREIDRRHKMSDTVLRIRSAKKSDEGRYTCTLSTGGGQTIFSLTMNLVVEDRERTSTSSTSSISPFDWNRAPHFRQPALPSPYGDIPRSGDRQTTDRLPTSSDFLLPVLQFSVPEAAGGVRRVTVCPCRPAVTGSLTAVTALTSSTVLLLPLQAEICRAPYGEFFL